MRVPAAAGFRPAGRTFANPLCLAAGHDRSGERAAELFAAGFGGVEFGSVAAFPDPGQADAGALAARLAPFAGRRQRPLIGINLCLAASRLRPAEDWLAGLRICAPAADYLAFNLSAEAARPLLADDAAPLLRQSFAALGAARDALASAAGRRPGLALKLPLMSPLPAAARLAAEAGFDALIAVLPGGADAPRLLHALRAALAAEAGRAPSLIAVGGIRCAADVARALAGGACAVQVHAAFAERGAACVGDLLGDAACTSSPVRRCAASAFTRSLSSA